MKRPKSVGGRQPFDHNAGRQDDADRPELQLWGANPYLRTAYDQLAYASDTNKHAAWPAVAKEWSTAMRSIMYNNKEIEPALDAFKKEAEMLLSK